MKRTAAKMYIELQGGKATFLLITHHTDAEMLADSLAHITPPPNTSALIRSYLETVKTLLERPDAPKLLGQFAASTVSKFPAHQIIWEIVTAADKSKKDELIKELSAELKEAWKIRRANELPPIISQRIKERFRPDDLIEIEKMIAEGDAIDQKKAIDEGGLSDRSNKRLYAQVFLENVATLTEKLNRRPTRAEINALKDYQGLCSEEVKRLVNHWRLVLPRGKQGRPIKKRARK
jgi:hypothetical protein